MALVFQYGSNTSTSRLNSGDRLCGDARDLGLVRTEAMFELDFDVWSKGNKCATANLRFGTGRVIWGVLYDVPDYLIDRATSGDRKSLDAIEGILYERQPIAVQAPDGTKLQNVVTYTVREPQQGLQTSVEYVSHILKGLRDHGAADEYLAYVKNRAVTNNPGLAADLERLWSVTADASAYFDIRNLTSSVGEPGGCPVSGCDATLGRVGSQWGAMPYCPRHRIRIHRTTFVYYNGPDEQSKRNAALRNILFERDYFKQHILDNAAKAETHRFCNETSEDALTWNVFSRLASAGELSTLLSSLTHSNLNQEPELYLWGLGVCLTDPSAPSLFPALRSARETFEKGVKRYLTEPDVMLYVPGRFLVLVEAKFTSDNPIASAAPSQDIVDEKPKSREGILRRYAPAPFLRDALFTPDSSRPLYSQLYRNLVFAMHMANELGVRWGLVSLVCEGQLHQRPDKIEFQDPTPSIHALLPEMSREQFVFYSWERLYVDHVAKRIALKDLAEYMCNKSANGVKALSI